MSYCIKITFLSIVLNTNHMRNRSTGRTLSRYKPAHLPPPIHFTSILILCSHPFRYEIKISSRNLTPSVRATNPAHLIRGKTFHNVEITQNIFFPFHLFLLAGPQYKTVRDLCNTGEHPQEADSSIPPAATVCVCVCVCTCQSHGQKRIY
jgi:hypothetical protein